MRLAVFLLGLGCGPALLVPPQPVAPIPVAATHALDTAPKEEPRLLPAEAYVRSYLKLFGAQTLLEVAQRARAGQGNQLFDTWADYLATLGFPDRRNDLPRETQTNAIMLATAERLAIALCDRTVERDLRGRKPLAARTLFAFELPPGPIDDAGFAARFDLLHRSFLGYPAALAPKGRIERFLRLYRGTVLRHAEQNDPPSRLSPAEAGWAVVCQGLARHPEFQLY